MNLPPSSSSNLQWEAVIENHLTIWLSGPRKLVMYLWSSSMENTACTASSDDRIISL